MPVIRQERRAYVIAPRAGFVPISAALLPMQVAGAVTASSPAPIGERPRRSDWPLPVLSPAPAITNDWSLSAWLLLRRGSGAQLAPGGILGGSQAGARLAYAVGPRTAFSARLFAPVEDIDAAEIALGVEWQPMRKLPVRLLAERRQAIGDAGRSAFSLLAYGGVSEARLAGPLRLDAYAQVGMVGLKSRDLFADGSARIAMPIARDFSIGVGLWSAAQPGAARLDVGPEVSYRLPNTPLRISAGYRVRVAGDARPASGPALTFAGDF